MAEKKIQVKITADNRQANQAVKTFGKTVDQTSKQGARSAKALTGALKGLAVAAGGLFAFQKVVGFVKNATAAYDKQAKAEAELARAIGGTSQRLLDQASALQKVTLFGDEETIQAQALIGALVKEEEQIARVIPLVQDLATAKGMDLTAAADLVSKTLGSSTNALSRYGIEVDGTVGSTERLESLTKNLDKAFGGAAKTAAGAGTGAITQFNNAVGDLMETIGEGLMPTMNALAAVGLKVVNRLQKIFDMGEIDVNDVINSTGVLKKELVGLNAEVSRLQEQQKGAPFTVLGGMGFSEEDANKLASAKARIKEIEEILRMRKKESGSGIPEVDDIPFGKLTEEKKQERIKAVEDMLLKQAETAGEARAHAMELEAEQYNARLDFLDQMQDREVQLMIDKNQRLLQEEEEAAKERKRISDSINNAIVDGATGVTNTILSLIEDEANAMAKSEEDKKKAARKSVLINAAMAHGGAAASIWTGAGSWQQKLAESIAVSAQLFAMQGTQLAAINRAAKGADFETNGPQLLLVGDNPGGRERVQVTPQSSPNVNGPRQGVNVSMPIIVNGNVTEDSLREIEQSRDKQVKWVKNTLRELQLQGEIPA